MKINCLIINYLEEQGFNIKEWINSEKIEENYKTTIIKYYKYYYTIIPGLHRLIITENKSGGMINLRGIPNFEMNMDIRNPDSLIILAEKLKKLYIWMKNINPEYERRLTHESTRFNGRVVIRDS